MEKRAFLAVILSIVVFYVYSFFLGPEKRPALPPQQGTTAPVSQITTPQSGSTVSVASSITAAIPVAVESHDTVIDTPLYSAVFSSRGGSLKTITLKKYREQNSPKAQQVLLGANADPSVLNLTSKTIGFNLPDASIWQSDSVNATIGAGDSRILVYTYVSPQGYTVRKKYTFQGSSYGIALETEISNNSAAPLVGAIQHVLTYPADSKIKDNRFDTSGSYLFADNALHADKSKDIAGTVKKYEKNVMWAGFADKYFLNAILSDKNSIASVEIKKNASGYLESLISTPQFTVTPGKMITVAHRIFFGPKDIDVLKSQGNSLEQSLDLGWFTRLAKPMLYTLKALYGLVGNYGLAIIIITVVLKLLFFPLTHKSYKSMKGMQKIQPEMTKIREKYKNDRDAMNKAVMELYRENKVNPLGGCLPMVVQIPVFFALYKALMFSIELRHAPFFLWITDLADKDPYYVTPVLMGISMFVQQKMTPSQMDPVQQKMMLALPVVFTVMFLSFPSGLVLYWFVNNMLTICQQTYINKS